MKKAESRIKILSIAAVAFVSAAAYAESPDMQAKLEASLQELSALRAVIVVEKLPMVKGLNSLEDELMAVRLDHQKIMRQLDSRNLDLNNLRAEIATRKQEMGYISNLLGEYTRNFETRLHIAELSLYRAVIDTAALAPENPNLSPEEIYFKQTGLVESSINRLRTAVGGSAFAGSAAGEDGLVKQGQLALIGPVALFAADDGSLAGIAEQRLGSLEPSVMAMSDAKMEQMVRDTVKNLEGEFPFDPSLGNARKIEETKETLGEHLKKGGFVVYPIVGMFILAVIVAAFKWIQLALIPMPSDKEIKPILQAMLKNDHAVALDYVNRVKGPTGTMLKAGIEHIDEPKDLVEEVMYEEMLTTRLVVNKYTSFIAICASSAPLLGLLGTVTGIINTFKLITVFGSGDVKTLSGGISEALITTELGLIVAIFSLVLYAFLSRKAKGITDRMEQIAILFINRATRTAPAATPFEVPDLEPEPAQA